MGVVKTWEVKRRREIVAALKKQGLRSGDIIVRLSDTAGPFGIPFSLIVAKLSNSRFSHASLILMRDDEPYVFEVSDRGTLEYRLIDWLDFCVGGDFAIYRLKDLTLELEKKLAVRIQYYLDADLDYDFTYDDPNKLYCTESSMQVYNDIGVPLVMPSLFREVIPPLKYFIFKICNAFIRRVSGKGFDMRMPMYFVGNEHHGILSSDKLVCICPENPFNY